MGKVYHNITELVGHTPLLQLERIEEKYETQAHIFAKGSDRTEYD